MSNFIKNPCRLLVSDDSLMVRMRRCQRCDPGSIPGRRILEIERLPMLEHCQTSLQEVKLRYSQSSHRMIKKIFGFFERNYLLSYLIVVVLAGFIYYISSLQFDPVQALQFDYKSVVYHFGVFLLFNLFLMICLSKGNDNDGIYLAVLFSLFYAVLDEVHQLFVPNRAADVFDLFIDSIGILFSYLFYFRIGRNRI